MSEIQTPRGSFWVADQRKTDDSRTVLLLIHGAGGSRLDWPGEIRRLPNAQVVAPDLAGHGRSVTKARETVADFSADVIALCDVLGIERCFLGGHSLGGLIALQTALDHPDRVCGLVLIGSGARLPVNAALMAALNTDPDDAKARIMRWSVPPGTPEDRLEAIFRPLRETPAESIAAAFTAVSTCDLSERLHEIRVPALIVVGSRDVMAPPALSEALAQGLPLAQLVTVEGGGHRVVNEQPAVVAAAIERWINEVPCP